MPSKESIHDHLSFHQSLRTLRLQLSFIWNHCYGLLHISDYEIRLELPSWLIKLFLFLNTYSDLITRLNNVLSVSSLWMINPPKGKQRGRRAITYRVDIVHLELSLPKVFTYRVDIIIVHLEQSHIG